MIKNILHLSRTPCAGAPGMLSDTINRYSEYNSSIYCHRIKIPVGDFAVDYKNTIKSNELKNKINEADLIHFHNCPPNEFGIGNKPFIIQLHSEPRYREHLVRDYPGKCITIAQKQAVLYKDIPYIPNMLPIFDEVYVPKSKITDKLRIVYSPTSKVRLDNYKDTCTGKGFKRTYRILMNFVTKFKDKVEIRVFSGGRPKREVLEAKAISDVVIDECVTGSYHLSSLEGLSTENIVIGNLMPEVKDVICEVSGSPREKLPWIECEIDNLYETLYKLMMLKFNDYVKFINRQLEGRIWMKEYWHPQNLVKHITKIYDKALNVENNPWKGLGVSSNIERVRDFRKKSHALYTKSKDLDIDYRTNIGFPNVPALILGNGPSLLRCDINSLLKNKNVIFTCNYFYKYFTDLIPDYWTCIDSTCLKECLGNVPLATKILINPPPIYTEIKHKRIWIDKFNGYFDHKFETERPCTVATIMVLFALYLRCDPIYIAGVDLSLEKTDKNYAYDDPVYNKKFRDFSNNYLHIIKEFKLIREEAKLRGVKIYNLDPEPKNFNVFEVADASIISQK